MEEVHTSRLATMDPKIIQKESLVQIQVMARWRFLGLLNQTVSFRSPFQPRHAQTASNITRFKHVISSVLTSGLFRMEITFSVTAIILKMERCVETAETSGTKKRVIMIL